MYAKLTVVRDVLVACGVPGRYCWQVRLWLVQASKQVGGSEVVSMELLPQLVPLFLCPPDQRGAYGSSIPPAAPSAPQPIRSAVLP